MAKQPVQERVKEIIVTKLGLNPDEMTPESRFIEDLGADSLDTVELMLAFEKEFGLKIPDEDAEHLLTVGAINKYIEEHCQKRSRQ